jgi:hypothetical protein
MNLLIKLISVLIISFYGFKVKKRINKGYDKEGFDRDVYRAKNCTSIHCDQDD